MINNQIKSKSNPIYKEFLDVKKSSSKSNLVLLEGEDLVNLAKDKKCLLKTCSYEEVDYGVKNFIFSNELLRELSSFKSLPKVIGIAFYKLSDDVKGERIIYLDGVQDPGNLGTIERSALAFNYKDIVLSSDCVSPFNHKAVSASKGAFLDLNISYNSLQSLKEKGYKLYMGLLDGKEVTQIDKPNSKFVIVVGSEGQGIKKENRLLADEKVYLPINREIESLNVGIAASILMFIWRE